MQHRIAIVRKDGVQSFTMNGPFLLAPQIRPDTRRKKKVNRAANHEGNLFLRGRMWSFRIRWRGERLVFSTGTRIKSEAVDWKNKKIAELLDGTITVTRPKPSGVLVNELIDDYISFLQVKGRKSAKIIAGVLNSKIRPVFGDLRAASIQTRDSTIYRAKMRSQIIDTTINRHLAYLHAALVHAYRRQTPRKLEVVPYFEMADESGNVRTGFIQHDGYRKILKELPASLKALFTCGFHVSTRKGELLKIRWQMVDLKEGIIELEPPNTKNGEGRYLPIYSDMVSALKGQKALHDREYPDVESVFFWHKEDIVLGHGGTRVLPGAPIKDFRTSWKTAVKNAGYEGLLFHDLRRSAQRNMRKAGIDSSIRKKISGHKTDSMERRYNIIDTADIKAAGRQLARWAKTQGPKRKR
jgi:integrase